MKLLFDQNISFRIIKLISEEFPKVNHVNELGLADSTDMAIWEFAKSNNYSIVTFDSDYYDLSIVKGCPPKIIWLRIGNTSTPRIAEVINENSELIQAFLTDNSYKDLSCLEIG